MNIHTIIKLCIFITKKYQFFEAQRIWIFPHFLTLGGYQTTKVSEKVMQELPRKVYQDILQTLQKGESVDVSIM